MKVRQSEGEQGNPLLPRGIWTKTPVWLKLSLFFLAAREVLPRSTSGIYTPQSSLTAHSPVEIDSLCFLQDECLFETLVAFEWTAVILQVPALWWFIEWELERNLLHHRANLFRFSCVHNIPLMLPTRVYKLSLEKDVYWFSITLSFCPSITLVSLSQSPPLFSYSGFYE